MYLHNNNSYILKEQNYKKILKNLTINREIICTEKVTIVTLCPIETHITLFAYNIFKVCSGINEEFLSLKDVVGLLNRHQGNKIIRDIPK